MRTTGDAAATNTEPSAATGLAMLDLRSAAAPFAAVSEPRGDVTAGGGAGNSARIRHWFTVGAAVAAQTLPPACGRHRSSSRGAGVLRRGLASEF